MGDSIQILDKVEVKDARYCKKLMKDMGIKVDTEEVLLSHKGLLDYSPMGHLLCLEVLWLNDNRITKVHGLDTNVQIKALYLHNNRINSLRGSLQHLKHIYTLSLYNNRLQDLEATLPLIQHLTHLEDLDLSGNPLANEVNYRLRVAHTFPTLKVLDKHEVTAEERYEARVLYEGIKVSNVAFAKTKPEWRNPPKQKIACLSVMTKDMYREINKFQETLKDEKAAADLAASQELSKTSRVQTAASSAPLAASVETMTTRSLQDVLMEDGLGEATRRAGSEKRHYGDFFQMKAFVRDTKPVVSVEDTLAVSRAQSLAATSRAGSRAPSRATSSAEWGRVKGGSRRSSANFSRVGSKAGTVMTSDIVLERDRYDVYEQLKDRPEIKSELKDVQRWIKG